MELRTIPISKIDSEDGVAELLRSENMEPYIRFHMAVPTGQPSTAILDEFRKIPLEKRYLWRIVSTLRWAFMDYDSVSAQLDRATLSPADFSKCQELLQSRPVQFCYLMAALYGPEAMESLMQRAISHVKSSPVAGFRMTDAPKISGSPKLGPRAPDGHMF